MRKTTNTVHIEGRVYEHELAVKTVKNQQSQNFGKEFIAGTIDIAVDEECTNIVQVHFTYVSEVTSKGNKNTTYTNLKKIIDDNKTVLSVGKDDAQKISVNTSISLNDFYNDKDELISAKRSEGGFVNIVNALNPNEKLRNNFTCDMVITSVTRNEANEDKHIPENVAIRGAIFDFKGTILPIEFNCEIDSGMNYFEGLGASNAEPVFTQVWGTVNGFKNKTTQTIDSAFGQPVVREYDSNRKVWLVEGARNESYDFGGEDLTVEELTKATQDREVYLADVKRRNDEYKASKAAQSSTPANAVNAAQNTIPTGNFKF